MTRMRTRRPKRNRTMLVTAVLTTTLLSGCFLHFNTPEINLQVEPAYNEWQILIPYELWGTGSAAQGRWTLNRLDWTTGAWEQRDSREVRLPNGSSGVLQFEDLDEAKYELVFELLTTRDGSYDVVPYLTERRIFYVDRQAPDFGLDAIVTENGGAVAPVDPGADAWLTVDYVGGVNPDLESPERFLAVAGEARPPVANRDELWMDDITLQARLDLWNAGHPTPMAYPVQIVLVDEAGNRSDMWQTTYTAP